MLHASKVGPRWNQHNVLLEAVHNHTPQALVVDEIRDRAEVAAVRTIAERGVIMVMTSYHRQNTFKLLLLLLAGMRRCRPSGWLLALFSCLPASVIQVATAHGCDISSLLRNPDMAVLLGGIETVTVGDAQAAKDRMNRKTRKERKGPPVFDTLIEVLDQVRSSGSKEGYPMLLPLAAGRRTRRKVLRVKAQPVGHHLPPYISLFHFLSAVHYQCC